MKIKGSDKVAAATRYFSGRQSLNRALRRERERFLNVYGGDPDDPTSCLFWYEARGDNPVSYVRADKSVRSSRKWSLCSTLERAAAFGAWARSNKEKTRALVASYLEAESEERRTQIAGENPWLPIVIQVRFWREMAIDRQFIIDRKQQQEAMIE